MMRNLLEFPVNRVYGNLKTGLTAFALLLLSGGLNNINAQVDPVYSCIVNDVTTVGGSDGSVTLDVTGLATPIEYEWWTAPPQYGSTASNLTKGVYYVKLTDASGYVDTTFCAVGEPFVECEGLRTQTQGGWGQKARGDNVGVYRDANFASIFPNGLVIGCETGFTISLTSAQAVEDFLPSNTTPAVLTQNYTDPDKHDLRNVFAGQVAALALSVAADNADPYFSSGTLKLKDQLIGSGALYNVEVEDLLAEANSALGGCGSGYSLADLHEAVTLVNENFVDGKRTGEYLNCVIAGGSIGDYVWIDANGNGQQDDGSGSGVAGAEIKLTYAGADGILGTADDEVFTTFTDANGVYDFTQLEAGLYRVEVVSNNLDADYVLTGGIDPRTVNLSEDQDYNYADFGYQERSASIGGSLYVDENGTGIQETGESGLSGVTVTATWFGADGIEGTADDEVFTTTTDANGSYTFSNLPAGDYTVDIDDSSVPDGYVLNDGSDPATITVANDESGSISEAGYWPRTSSISSSLYEDLDGDSERDAGEPGLEGVTIELVYYGPDGILGTADDEYFTTTTDADGQFTFADLPAGEYDLTIVESTLPAGYLPGTSGTSDHITLSTAETSSPNGGYDFLSGTADVNLTVSAYPPLIFSVFQTVTYTYEVDNTGDYDLSNVTVTDSDCPPSYVSGDVNSDGLLNTDETWTYECSRTWTWSPGQAVTTSPTVEADDPSNNTVSDSESTYIGTIGVNMDVQTSVSAACPGDTILVRLVSRLISSDFLTSEEDFQFFNLEASCNLLNGGQYWSGGPSSAQWADPSGDYVNSRSGSYGVALDYDDYVDYDNGFNAADWVHEFNYVIPAGQSADLVISASDRAQGYYYKDGTWSTFDSLVIGSDQEIVSIGCGESASGAPDKNVENKNINENIRDISSEIVTGFNVYPSLFSDQLTIESSSDMKDGRIEIIDAYGKLVYSNRINSARERIDLTSLPTGKYWVRITNAESVMARSVIKIK